MKLRNFMYATMIACAFASCSNDDVIENGPDAKGDASLTIKIDTKGTKAYGSGDETINELAVFLYKVTGEESQTKTLAGHEYVASNYNNGQIVFEGLTAGDKYMCVGFANLGNVSEAQATGTNPILLSISEGLYEATDVPMHGISTVVTIKANEDTEATINLYRDLAKVELESVVLNMNYVLDGERYGDYSAGTAKFQFLSASVNSAAQATSYKYSNAGTVTDFTNATTFVGGLGNTWKWGELTNTGSAITGYKIAPTSALAEATQLIGDKDAATENKDGYDAKTVAKPSSVVFYVLPNTTADDKTTLTLEGKMTLENAVKGQQTINNVVTGFYNIEIGKDANAAEGSSYEAGSGVHANDYFKISVIVVGTGDGVGGEQPKLIVKTTVAKWNEISQTTPVK